MPPFRLIGVGARPSRAIASLCDWTSSSGKAITTEVLESRCYCCCSAGCRPARTSEPSIRWMTEHIAHIRQPLLPNLWRVGCTRGKRNYWVAWQSIFFSLISPGNTRQLAS